MSSNLTVPVVLNIQNKGCPSPSPFLPCLLRQEAGGRVIQSFYPKETGAVYGGVAGSFGELAVLVEQLYSFPYPFMLARLLDSRYVCLMERSTDLLLPPSAGA